MISADIFADAESARNICKESADVIIDAAEQLMSQADEISEREPLAAAFIRSASLRALEACAFQDTVGQLLTRISAGPSDNPLLAGPNAVDGLSPEDVDALMDVIGAASSATALLSSGVDD